SSAKQRRPIVNRMSLSHRSVLRPEAPVTRQFPEPNHAASCSRWPPPRRQGGTSFRCHWSTLLDM
ncbi:hypothetical protein J6590_061118, partial [Homalodisca vitripennis]